MENRWAFRGVRSARETATSHPWNKLQTGKNKSIFLQIICFFSVLDFLFRTNLLLDLQLLCIYDVFEIRITKAKKVKRKWKSWPWRRIVDSACCLGMYRACHADWPYSTDYLYSKYIQHVLIFMVIHYVYSACTYLCGYTLSIFSMYLSFWLYSIFTYQFLIWPFNFFPTISFHTF